MRPVRTALMAMAGGVVMTLAAAYLVLRHDGLAADRPPGRIETAIARRLVLLSIPADARAAVNPHASDPDAWRNGAGHFGEHCAACHGGDGRGRSQFGARMYPPVPDLGDPAIQAFSDGALFSIIQRGVRWTGMPAFRAEHSDEETWRLVSFVRHVPRMSPDADTHETAAAPAHEHGAVIVMDGTTFEPRDITVKVGERVTWINRDPFPHNVTSASAGMHSGSIEPEQRRQFHAATPGTYRYVCTLHPGMSGRLVVTR